jgi:hypothetical protein
VAVFGGTHFTGLTEIGVPGVHGACQACRACTLLDFLLLISRTLNTGIFLYWSTSSFSERSVLLE